MPAELSPRSADPGARRRRLAWAPRSRGERVRRHGACFGVATMHAKNCMHRIRALSLGMGTALPPPIARRKRPAGRRAATEGEEAEPTSDPLAGDDHLARRVAR